MNLPGRVRVSETHGIRRFFYPVSVEIPASIMGPDGCTSSSSAISLVMGDGNQVPLQVTPGVADPELSRRLDFAVSLSPFEKMELKLFSKQPESVSTGQAASLDDPVQTVEEKRFRSCQSRFSTEFDRLGTLHAVEYDSAPHLRSPALFIRNGLRASLEGVSAFAVGFRLGARVCAAGKYPDGCGAETLLETTACKSWVTLTHFVSSIRAEDELVFKLPSTVFSSVVTCDFGAGGGIYGNLRAGSSPEIVWVSRFLRSGAVSWSIASGERADYVGETQTAEEYLSQRWFHLIDGQKALAVAITRVPDCCREMKVTIATNGDVTVAFKAGQDACGPAAFGLCCHFLNNIPAIAAATNPQSILLPPVVAWERQDA